MKQQDLIKHHQQAITELENEITKLEKSLVDARMQRSVDKLKDLRVPTKIRHDISRLKTIITLKKLTEEETPKPEVKKVSKPTDKTKVKETK